MKRGPSVIVQRLGQEKADRLSAIVGGTRLHVPGNLTNAGRLKQLLGEDLAILVVLHFGDSRFYVPTGVAEKPVVKVGDVKRLTAKGWSAERIARELKCSFRTVENKRAAYRRRTQPGKDIA